ncbi:SUN domain-containing ossification factor [Nephila pilipes]|uniref:SUN domain-containing ossification factor n=1 Tax=Nephila pilipes TaxID=299642 RepID=A0A8X6TZX7_NEPPI|nr:SUN domain-containing ossification factor [Nephila pilipes]
MKEKKREFRNSVTNAIQLVGLLCLLFWSFTWNTPNDFDLPMTRKSFKGPATKCCLKDDSITEYLKTNSFVVESFKTVKYVGGYDWKVSTVGNSLLPPFNVWKEVELNKQEKVEGRDKIVVPKTTRRKLNYASSKCGAKILASNKDSKHRMSILNEKADEYMLNSCKIKVWFVVELCDTIEATQIELANYELFSSSPKEFSVFSSSIYPTQTWNLLGAFEAKNQRTMQVFNLDFQNHGNFIKVVIFTNYGKEHFCTLSVFRVVGYSMVYYYDEIMEESIQNYEKNTSLINETDNMNLKEKTSNYSNENTSISNTLQSNNGTKRKWNLISDSLLKFCQMTLKYCNFTESSKTNSHQSACLFFKSIHLKNETICDDIWTITAPTANFKSTYLYSESLNLVRETKQPSNFTKYNGVDDVNKKLNRLLLEFQNPSTSSNKIPLQITNSSNKIILNKTLKRRSSDVQFSQQTDDNLDSSTSSKVNRSIAGINDKISKNIKGKNPADSDEHCDCSKYAGVDETEQNEKSSETSQIEYVEDVIDSATQMQKESVLVKLTMRIKESETNLNFINKYLQQLSESYRRQIEDMLRIFSGTVKAIRVTSEKAAVVDKQQQTSIEGLQIKIKYLSSKIKYLEVGQKDILKQVLELHGFFLILDLIIMSTIFSIFFNKFRHNEHSFK